MTRRDTHKACRVNLCICSSSGHALVVLCARLVSKLLFECVVQTKSEAKLGVYVGAVREPPPIYVARVRLLAQDANNTH